MERILKGIFGALLFLALFFVFVIPYGICYLIDKARGEE